MTESQRSPTEETGDGIPAGVTKVVQAGIDFVTVWMKFVPPPQRNSKVVFDRLSRFSLKY